jgi:predicted O-methyltransferase YrrM
MHEAIRRSGRLARNTVALWRQHPYVAPGHFYSPLTTDEDAQRAEAWRGNTDITGIDLRADAQLELAAKLRPMWTVPTSTRYDPDNPQYGAADAAVLKSMLLHERPPRILEVGSGYSTAIMLDAADETGMQISCVEPYPDRLFGRLQPGDRQRIDLQRVGAQDVPVERFASLEAGDVLFIDSTHVAKAGSDVIWLYLHVLPHVQPGVLVHIHDIFWPFEYPSEWLQQHRDWTELYLLRAMLTGTASWRIELFSSWLWTVHPETVPDELRDPGPGNIWLRKMA